MGADRLPQAGHEWEDEVNELRGDIRALRADMGKLEGALRSDMNKLECSLRADMGRMESGLRGDMAKLESTLRSDMSRLETTLLKWSFLFWIGQVIALSGVMGVLLRARL